MRASYAVTLEFEREPPLTTRGEVSASAMPVCARLAAREALLAFPRKSWASLVIVLERLAETEPQP